ncbi:hypothetical protein [Pandoraea sp. ISTKB]|uniref:hypothetical protein n=1 Tax=Pandoraea sp. ISTKB TaxID=1586708 RepID=UPI0008467CE9|nr:hypothetical protein [Pandoraea sp. ISTKB]ODP35094.1 hypothetical protein A9762_12080 [Pandoraea sp. ISTKB]
MSESIGGTLNSVTTQQQEPEPAIALVRLLQQHRFDLSTEKHLQAEIEDVLLKAGITFEREKRLSAGDIPDFLVAGGVVVECKIRDKSRKIEVFKQLQRYAQHPSVSAIVLASNMAMGLPPDINGKPVYAASLSRGWI